MNVRTQSTSKNPTARMHQPPWLGFERVSIEENEETEIVEERQHLRTQDMNVVRFLKQPIGLRMGSTFEEEA